MVLELKGYFECRNFNFEFRNEIKAIRKDATEPATIDRSMVNDLRHVRARYAFDVTIRKIAVKLGLKR